MRNNHQNQYSIVKATTIGTIVSVILVLICTVCITTFMLTGNLSDELARIMEPTFLAISIFAGTIAALRKVDQAYLVVSALIVLSYIAISAAINIIMFDGTFVSVWSVIAASVISAGFACILKISKRKKNKHFHKHR